MKTPYEQIYQKIYQIVPELDKIEEGDAIKLKSAGYMDLNIDVLSRNKDTTIIAMSHYYKHPSGDMIADPDMEIKLYHNIKSAEALTFQDIRSYRVVYPEEGKVNPRAKTELNHFLNYWLNNLKNQGFQQETEQDINPKKINKGR